MGTVEKIVDHLNRMCVDKKIQATERYEEHSAWLTSEFDKIRDLLQYNCPKKDVRDDASETRQKRKSPETCSHGSRNSPMTKRTSADYMELAVADGLPADLNRLKKEELLEALEARGNSSMTMKALKKDLIEALKDVLLDIHLRKNTVPAMASTEDEDSPMVENSEEEVKSPESEVMEETDVKQDMILDTHQETVAEEVPTSERRPSAGGSPARKQSILAEARYHVSEVRASMLQERVESEEDRSKRLAREYEARKMRHRSSQIRLSQVTSRPEDIINQQTKEEGIRNADEEQVVASAEAEVQEMDHHEDDENGEEDTSVGETWNEVPSPHTSTSASLAHATKTSQDNKSKTLPDPSAVSKITAALDTQPKSEEPMHPTSTRAEKAKTLPAPVKPAESGTTSVSRPVSVKATDSADSVNSNDSDASNKKGFKLTNLVGGSQTSFLSSSSNNTTASTKPKTVVPALQKAALLKEKEEARALQKKKELEEKKKEHMRKLQNAAQNSAINASSSKLFQSSKAAAKPVPSSSTTQKKGFGWFGNKKDAIVKEAPSKEPITSSASSTASKASSKPVAAPAPRSVPAPSAQEEPRAEVIEQENLKPSAIAAATPAAAVVPPTAVLQEKKIVASEYKTTTPVKTAHMSDNSYEASPSPPREEYKIDDRDDSSSDDGSGTDDDDDDKQQIPEWAKGPKLREALERQYGVNGHTAVDPDLIFPDIQTCNLEEIFGRREGKCGKYSVRTSSAKWDADQITLVEKRKYRCQMGFSASTL
mmetsp:Transcript_26263/g.38934  ORF Transcript_26263/g.38934 Transcript_26263/m.38934 type:complete len:768 (+) Transcript_26263:107-2410(+)|eukprot:CAMPEP_0185036796 /NCGR_PEP_ID=MMETSP1103-20130426/30266_1 /TAXON_ID=36769 /ORGANISM="Paraphysomonas bandaiensis, Strain Caron Lab Isolate" /LENGTH=767 /DNA_ID=CAMNT_0027574473 /DNA_START=38 /DNA_END=2341 /DNA_ORIENTATION=-